MRSSCSAATSAFGFFFVLLVGAVRDVIVGASTRRPSSMRRSIAGISSGGGSSWQRERRSRAGLSRFFDRVGVVGASTAASTPRGAAPDDHARIGFHASVAAVSALSASTNEQPRADRARTNCRQ